MIMIWKGRSFNVYCFFVCGYLDTRFCSSWHHLLRRNPFIVPFYVQHIILSQLTYSIICIITFKHPTINYNFKRFLFAKCERLFSGSVFKEFIF